MDKNGYGMGAGEGDYGDPYMLLFSLTRILNTGHSLVDALESFLGATSTVLGMDRLAILVTPSAQECSTDRRKGRKNQTLPTGYKVFAAHNFDADLLAGLGGSISAAVLKRLDDTASDSPKPRDDHEHFFLTFEDQGRESALYIVPLTAGQRATGLLLMSRESSDNYDYNLSFLTSLADQIAFAIARDQDLRMISERHRKVSALFSMVREMDVTLSQDEMVDRFLRGIYSFIPYDATALLLRNDQGLNLRCATVGGKPSKAVVANTAGRLVAFFNHEMSGGLEPFSQTPSQTAGQPGPDRKGQEESPQAQGSVMLEIDHVHYPMDPSIKGFEEDVLHTRESMEALSLLDGQISSGAGEGMGHFGTEFILPLKIENQRMGVIYVGFSERDLLDSHDAKLLSIVGYHLATVLENARLFKRNQRLAYTDGVTGVANHRLFQETLEAEFDRAHRYGHPISMLLMDVDHFKNFNDTYGHRHGDTVLREIGKVLEATARRNVDTVARYGGEEFTAIIPSTGLQGALTFGERIRKAVENLEIRTEDGRLTRVTVSVGISTAFGDVQPSVETPETLIESADKAMYNAKNGGRNRVETIMTMKGSLAE